jgi:hypothetical protein
MLIVVCLTKYGMAKKYGDEDNKCSRIHASNVRYFDE